MGFRLRDDFLFPCLVVMWILQNARMLVKVSEMVVAEHKLWIKL